MPRRVTVLIVCPLALLAACGNSRTPVPSASRPAPPQGFRALSYPGAGIRLRAPSNWIVASEHQPLVATISSGPAVVAVWRFPTRAPLPTATAALVRAQSALIAAVRARDPTLRLVSSSLVSVDGARGIELDALERIARQTRRVRSTHVFVGSAELVLDEYAPPTDFGAVDRAVFAAVSRSLRFFPARAP